MKGETLIHGNHQEGESPKTLSIKVCPKLWLTTKISRYGEYPEDMSKTKQKKKQLEAKNLSKDISCCIPQGDTTQCEYNRANCLSGLTVPIKQQILDQ